MVWWLWVLVAIGSVVPWFLMGAIASFLWSEVNLRGMSRQAKKSLRRHGGSKFMFRLGPLGLLVILTVFIFDLLFIALFTIADHIMDGGQRMVRSSPVRTLTSPFRWIARI